MKARLELGNLLWAGKDFKGAEEQAHYVVEHDPNNADGYTLMGTTYFAMKDTDQAMQAYNKVIELKPNDSGAYLNRGVLYASTKRDAEAEADFRKAISLNPKNLEAYSNLSRFYCTNRSPQKPKECCRRESRTIRIRRRTTCGWRACCCKRTGRLMLTL